MDIDTAEARRVEDFFRQDQAIGDHYSGVEVQFPKSPVLILILQREWGENRDTMKFRRHMYRRHPLYLAASGGTGRLAVDGGDLMSGGDQRFQNGHGEVGGTHEGKPEVGDGGGERGGSGMIYPF